MCSGRLLVCPSLVGGDHVRVACCVMGGDDGQLMYFIDQRSPESSRIGSTRITGYLGSGV